MKMKKRRKITAIVCRWLTVITAMLLLCIQDIDLDMIWVPGLMLVFAATTAYIGHQVGAWGKDIWQ